MSAHHHLTTLRTKLTIASTHEDLDDACALLQDALGITTGDFAGIFFSDVAAGDWAGFHQAYRYVRLKAYVLEEIQMFALEGHPA